MVSQVAPEQNKGKEEHALEEAEESKYEKEEKKLCMTLFHCKLLT